MPTTEKNGILLLGDKISLNWNSKLVFPIINTDSPVNTVLTRFYVFHF